MTSESAEIVVVGSLNLDVVVPVRHLPAHGQTVTGGESTRGCGGKGGNQAVAASRLGRSVAMVAAVGEDPDGDWLRTVLDREGVDISAVHRTAERRTGQAVVLVTADGDSTIVVSPGANGWLSPGHVAAASRLFVGARCLLLQHEVSTEVVAAAVGLAEGLVLLNPAPARPVDAAILRRVDLLVPNRGELVQLVGAGRPDGAGWEGAPGFDALAAMARSLGVRGQVVVTLGADGALVVNDYRYELVPAEPVEAADTTAAGDAFCAALADAVLDGASVVEAARFANRVAALTVTRPGAMDSLPHRRRLFPGEPDRLIGQNVISLDETDGHCYGPR
ncbi:ribokinase [Micromonospora sp. NPDC049900]|uniref:ribokinase n=1 Tax=Micromonospora sp. NPDC049900 TaxID=3364275 RepID=UPI00378BF80E